MPNLTESPGREDADRIAIIGLAGRFPGAPDTDTFWRNLEQGRECIGFFSAEELAAQGVGQAQLAQENFVRAKGALDGADRFDAGFFGYSPREAQILDPQHRLFLECAWEALESAGCDPAGFAGRIGVFAGTGLNSYLIRNVLASRAVLDAVGEYQLLLASDKDFLATRVAYKLGLTGPAITVQTACSTSLTAVHLACQSLLNGECDIALAGGVAVSTPLKSGYSYEPGGILAPDGHCRPFDAKAGGTVPGNGAGIVVLRRLADAVDSGDAVTAVILGTAINNDGSLKAGFTAPSVNGQADVITEALAVAGVTADTIGYVETHGTGTVLGDPIEIAALTRAFRADTAKVGYCAIGSVKGNVGHLDCAAGVAALIKTALMLQREMIPPSLNFTEPNPELELAGSPFFVCDERRLWPRPEPETPRRAGVSSFGIGGTNVHVVLEEAPALPASPEQPDGPDRAAAGYLLPLSAKTPEAVAQYAQRLAGYLDEHPGAELGDVAYTLARRRRAFASRRGVACRDRDDALAALRRVRPADVVTAAEKGGRVAFLFPGQGAQYVGMARGLYEQESGFAAEVDRCAALFAPHLGLDLRPLLFAPPGEAEAAARLEQTELTQPALFLIEYSLARLWSSWGVRPAALAGHSIGEYAAACLAGVFSLADAVRLVAARGRLVRAMPPGSMLTVFLPESDLAKWLSGDLSLAAVNSTALSVVSGPAGAVSDLEQKLKAAGISCRRLRTSHAFHSPSMDDAVGPLADEVRGIALNPPRIPFCSGVTGTWITDEQATSADYWGRQLRQTVRFGATVRTLLSDPSLVLLEVGPGHTLSSFVSQHQDWRADRMVAGSLRHPSESEDDRVYLLRSLGSLWSSGAEVDWGAVGPRQAGQVLRLPGYAFQRQRYWVEPAAGAPRPGADGQPKPAGNWFRAPGWKRLPAAGGGPAGGEQDPLWVVLGADAGLGGALAGRLEEEGASVARVCAGVDLGLREDGSWSLDPASRDHYARLLSALGAGKPRGIRFVHLFSLGARPADRLDEDVLRHARRLGFDSVLALAQGIGDARVPVPAGIDVLCRGIRSVTGEERLQPENAPLTGVCTVIPQEFTDLSCRTLDITGTDPEAAGEQEIRAVRDILARPTEDRDLALRGRHWWYRDFDAIALEERPGGGTGLRDDGVYLITGGLGGVGLALAEYIAGHAARPVLALLSWSEFPAEEAWARWLDSHDDLDPTSARIRRLIAMREMGARVVVRRGDVADPELTAAQVGDLRDRYGALNGVIHAAGLPAAGMIVTKTSADADRVFAAKIRGTLALAQACATTDLGAELDFFILCSSVTAVLGGPGQSDYCAANAFLDTFAEWQRQRGGLPVTAVAWGTWNGVGMAARPGSRRRNPDRAGEASGQPSPRRVDDGDGDGRRIYASTFRTDESWIVGDHRLMGHGLVPGTAYLEIARAALAQQAGEREIELRDVLFLMPLIVPDGQSRTVYTTIEEQDGELRFTAASLSPGGSSWRQHATGVAVLADRGADTVRDLGEVLARCQVTEVVDTEEEIRRRFRVDQFAKGAGPLEFGFGPRWWLLRKVSTGGSRMLATLRLDDAFLADLDAYPLHPAILDMAGGVFRMLAEDLYYLPLTYQSVRILGGLTSTVYCSVEIRERKDAAGEVLACDFELLGPDGRLLVQVTGFTVKRINDIPALVGEIEREASAAEAAPEQDARVDPAGWPSPGSALRALSEGMSERDGQTAFGAILAAASLPGQLVVSPADFAELRGLARSITPSLLAQEAERLVPPALTHPRPDLDTPYAAPGTDEERAIAAIWQEVLGLEAVGVNDDFFSLGGHSLAAVQIGTKIQRHFGVELDLSGFFTAPTVAQAAGLLAAGQAAGGQADDVIGRVQRAEAGDEVPYLDQLSDEEVAAWLEELVAQEAESPDGGM